MSITVIGIGSICFLFFVAGIVALGVYAFSRGNRQRQVPSRRTAFDPSAFREQLVENIVRDAGGQPSASRAQAAKNIDSRVPKNVIYAGLLGLILLAVIIAVVAIAAARSITDPSVAQTAIFNISMGLILLVAIVGAVVVIVAKMILKTPSVVVGTIAGE